MSNLHKILLTIFFVVLFFSPQLTKACYQLDSSVAVPAGFGAAYDVLSPGSEIMIKTNCDNPTLAIEVGDGDSWQYVYENAYFYRDGAWEQFTFTNSDGSGWVVGTAIGSLFLSAAERLNTNYIVAYMCTWTGTEWKCGCADAACATNMWQLQIFEYPTSSCTDSDGDGYDDCNVGDPGDDGRMIDCDDHNSWANPGGFEVCDTVDNNCSGNVDEGCDDDSDGYCDATMELYGGNSMCTNNAYNGDGTHGQDCDDNRASINPSATEICDGVDNNCDRNTDEGCTCTDNDGDGYDTCSAGDLGDDGLAEDCDDNAWDRSPGIPEICDSVDNNCDDVIDEGGICCIDTDGDGFDSCSIGEDGDDGNEIDCDDTQWYRNPSAPETCDNNDNNCNSTVDEGCDDDGDGYCTSTIRFYNYPVARCLNTNLPDDSYGDDCDDANYNANPGITETCDGVDNNCDGTVDEGCSCINGQTQVCGTDVGACRIGSQTCSGGTWGSCVGEVSPIAEVCGDSIDNNCDGIADEGCPTCFDNDSDGFDDCSPGETGDDGNQIDCDDNEYWINPNATETCDTMDNNCNTQIDEGCDDDNDNYCDSTMTLYRNNTMCSNTVFAGDGISGNDCDDNQANINPGITEVCDGVDNNCEGTVDEGCNCSNGETQVCGSSVGACSQGTQTCSGGTWGSCVGEVGPTAEVCGDSIDNDCNGVVDDACFVVAIKHPDDGYAVTQGGGEAMGMGISFEGYALGGNPPYNYSWNSDKVGDFSTEQWPYQEVFSWSLGEHVITMTVSDNNGQIGTDQISVNLHSVDDLIAEISLWRHEYTPTDSLFLGSRISGGTSPYTFSWSSDREGVFSTEQWPSVDLSTWSMGKHVLTLTVTDVAANTVISTTEIDILDISLEAYPEEGQYIEQNFDVHFWANVNGGTSPYSFEVNSSIDGLLHNSGFIENNFINPVRDDLSLGQHDLTFTVEDSNGLIVSKINRIQIGSMTPISITVNSPTPRATYRKGEDVSFDAISEGGVYSTITSWTSSIDGELSTQPLFTMNNLSVGVHDITILASDTKGNTHTEIISVTIQDALPLAPSIMTPSPGSVFTQVDDVISFSGSAVNGVPPYDYTWSSSLSGVFGDSDSVAINELAIGNNNISFSVEDMDGTVATANVSIDVQPGCFSANTKNTAMYNANEAFMISNDDWRNVLSMVPLTTWRDSGLVLKYPTLIYHEESSSFDVDSILHFLRMYEPTRLTTVGTTPSNINNFLVTSAPIGADLDVSQVVNRPVSDYFAYWSTINTIVVVDYDDYRSALLGSVLASHLNSPIIFVDSSNLLTYQAMIDGRSVYSVGVLDTVTSNYIQTNASCYRFFMEEEFQQWYAGAVNSNKLMFVNPSDRSISYPTTYATKVGGTINTVYSGMSLAAPFLAAAKGEVIAFTDLPNSGTNSTTADSALITSNIAQADADALYAIENLFVEKPEFLTIVASPSAIPDSEYESNTGSWQFRSVEDWQYGSVAETTESHELKTGRIFGLSVADASSYIARSLNYDFLKNKIYGTNHSLAAVGHDFEVAMNYSQELYENGIANAYDSVCYTGEDRTGCTTQLPPPTSIYENRNYLAYLDHGSPYGWWLVLDRANIPDLSVPVVVSSACLTNNYWQYTNRNFGAHILRSGGMAHYGGTGVTWTSSFPIVERALVEMGTNPNTTLGEVHQKLLYTRDYSLLGDPTLEPKFKSLTWN